MRTATFDKLSFLTLNSEMDWADIVFLEYLAMSNINKIT